MFNPGESAVHSFTIPFVKEELKKVIVTYKNKDDVFLTKTITSGFKDGETELETVFDIALSQAESLLFKENIKYKIQINVFTYLGSRMASAEIESKTGPQHYMEVISGGQ